MLYCVRQQIISLSAIKQYLKGYVFMVYHLKLKRFSSTRFSSTKQQQGLAAQNNMKHKSQLKSKSLKRNKIKAMECPAQSPGLTLIGMLWTDNKYQLRPLTLTELKQFCREWAKTLSVHGKIVIGSYNIHRILWGYGGWTLLVGSSRVGVSNRVRVLGIITQSACSNCAQNHGRSLHYWII